MHIPRSIEPATLVRYPPAKDEQRQSKPKTPPDRQRHIHHQAQDNEEHPEDLFFHLEKPYH